jgi:hypothetical protein
VVRVSPGLSVTGGQAERCAQAIVVYMTEQGRARTFTACHSLGDLGVRLVEHWWGCDGHVRSMWMVQRAISNCSCSWAGSVVRLVVIPWQPIPARSR